MVKQLGTNPSQIDGIDIGKGKTDKLSIGKILHVVGMKYPQKLSAYLSPKDADGNFYIRWPFLGQKSLSSSTRIYSFVE